MTRLLPSVWWALAAHALLAGYGDLARGGTTLAPLLLVLGYCVLVPTAILRGARATPPPR
jgi:hypothetical protein